MCRVVNFSCPLLTFLFNPPLLIPQDFIPADHDADTVWESYNYIKSAYEGRISDIVLAN